MIKFIGAVLILISTSAIGFHLAKQFSERPRQIRMFRSALQALEAEIIYSLTPVGEAAAHISAQFPQPVKLMFQHFQSDLYGEDATVDIAWEKAIEATWPMTSLKKSEKEILRQFGTTLGKHDADQQRKSIRLALSHLEREEQEARMAQSKNEKMYKSLGLLSGLLIALVLY